MESATAMKARSRVGWVFAQQSRSLTRSNPVALRESIRRCSHGTEAGRRRLTVARAGRAGRGAEVGSPGASSVRTIGLSGRWWRRHGCTGIRIGKRKVVQLIQRTCGHGPAALTRLCKTWSMQNAGILAAQQAGRCRRRRTRRRGCPRRRCC